MELARPVEIRNEYSTGLGAEDAEPEEVRHRQDGKLTVPEAFDHLEARSLGPHNIRHRTPAHRTKVRIARRLIHVPPRWRDVRRSAVADAAVEEEAARGGVPEDAAVAVLDQRFRETERSPRVVDPRTRDDGGVARTYGPEEDRADRTARPMPVRAPVMRTTGGFIPPWLAAKVPDALYAALNP